MTTIFYLIVVAIVLVTIEQLFEYHINRTNKN